MRETEQLDITNAQEAALNNEVYVPILSEEDIKNGWGEVDDKRELLEGVNVDVETFKAKVDETEAEATRISAAIEGLQEEVNSFDIVGEMGSAAYNFTSATSSMQGELEKLATEYDSVYESAYASISGQIGLFSEMETKSDLTIGDMQSNMESQVEYLALYSENLEKASELGLAPEMLTQLSDGSPESAGYLNEIVESGDAEAVEALNQLYIEKEKLTEGLSHNIAEQETGLFKTTEELAKEAVAKLELEGDALKAATTMMDAYIEGIKSKTFEVNSALGGVQFAHANPYNYINPPTILPQWDHTPENAMAHAMGGIFNEPHYGVFAEAGPEAFIPIDGSDNAISIWQETGNMLGMMGDSDSNSNFYVEPPEALMRGSSEKVITLKIEGSGDMRINSNTNKEDVLKIMVENVKGVLADILQQEILEEGDMSYEY